MPAAFDQELWQQHAWLNRLQTLLLFCFMGLLLAVLGWIIWGAAGIVILLLGGVIFLLFNPILSPQLMLRLYQARPIEQWQAPGLYQISRELAARAGLEIAPVLYYVPSQMINALTVGNQQQAVIALTDGLLRNLNTRETIGVLAHETAHIANNDIQVMNIADLFSRMAQMLSLFGQLLLLINLPLYLMSMATINWLAVFVLLFAPAVAALAQMGLSRLREHHADLNAVRLSGDPEGLASALEKIEYKHGNWLHKLMYKNQVPEASLLRTHPPTDERIRRLLALRTQQETLPQTVDLNELIQMLQQQSLRRPRRHRISGLWR